MECARLAPTHAQRIVAIAGDGDQGLIALRACQAYILSPSTIGVWVEQGDGLPSTDTFHLRRQQSANCCRSQKDSIRPIADSDQHLVKGVARPIERSERFEPVVM